MVFKKKTNIPLVLALSKSISDKGTARKRKSLPKIVFFFWTSEQPFAIHFLLMSCNVCPVGVTTSRATSGGRRQDRNTSGQRGNKFNTSYRDISVIVAENNSVVKPNYQQYTSLNKMLSNFSKVLMAHMSFTAVINNGGIRKGIGGIQKGTKKNYIYVL